jgi:hypothetical protein
LLQVRNDLAHAKSEHIDGIDYLIISRKDDEQPLKIDQNKCTQMPMRYFDYFSIFMRQASSSKNCELRGELNEHSNATCWNIKG